MRLVLLCFVLLLNACGGGSGPTLNFIAVTAPSSSLAAGLGMQLTATGSYSDGSTMPLTSSVDWSSSNGSVLQVSPTGMASGLKAGAVTVVAAAGGIKGSLTLTVSPAVLQSVTLQPANPTVPAGTNQTLTAVGSYSDGTTQALPSGVTWRSSAVQIATVADSGLVSALVRGSTVVSATVDALSASTTVIVATNLALHPYDGLYDCERVPVAFVTSVFQAEFVSGVFIGNRFTNWVIADATGQASGSFSTSSLVPADSVSGQFTIDSAGKSSGSGGFYSLTGSPTLTATWSCARR